MPSAKGVSVTKKLNIGERAVYMGRCKDGSINFFPEYNGSILDYLDPTATAKTPADVVRRAAGGRQPSSRAEPGAGAGHRHHHGDQATASKYNLKSIGDLARWPASSPSARRRRSRPVPTASRR